MAPDNTFNFGDCKPTAAVFQSPFNEKHFYIVMAGSMDTLQFMHRYCQGAIDCKQASRAQLDSDGDHFYMCYSEDCFDPPIVIVRAGDMEEAVDIFVDEFPNLGGMDDEEAARREKEGLEDTIGYTGSGGRYDSERVMLMEVQLVRLEFEPVTLLPEKKKHLTTRQLVERAQDFVDHERRALTGNLCHEIERAWQWCEKQKLTHDWLLEWRTKYGHLQEKYTDFLTEADKACLETTWDIMQRQAYARMVFCYEIDGVLISSKVVVDAGMSDRCSTGNGCHCWVNEDGTFTRWS